MLGSHQVPGQLPLLFRAAGSRPGQERVAPSGDGWCSQGALGRGAGTLSLLVTVSLMGQRRKGTSHAGVHLEGACREGEGRRGEGAEAETG